MFNLLKTRLIQIRELKPLILNLSNLVSMDFLANGLLAIGAAPIMSNEIEEIEELVGIVNSININTGTVTVEFFKMAEKAVEIANKLGKHIIFDPVGSGVSNIRTMVSLKLLTGSSIVKGNANEILSLGQELDETYRFKVPCDLNKAIHSASTISTRHNVTTVITGQTDIIVSAKQKKHLSFGSPLMTTVTGMGCLMGTIIAAFHTVELDSFRAATLATLYFTLCGEIAEKKTRGPGSFKVEFLDELYDPNFDYFQERMKELKLEDESYIKVGS